MKKKQTKNFGNHTNLFQYYVEYACLNEGNQF